MSICEDLRDLILEAEPDELRGIGDGRVAEHVRACRSCAHLAAVLLEETEALDAYLDAEPATTSVEQVLRRAGVADLRITGTPWRAGRAWVRRSRWVALAAAASVAVLILTRGHGPAPAPTRVALARAEPLPLVQSSPDRTVAVIQTEDPDITVLWFFQGGEDR